MPRFFFDIECNGSIVDRIEADLSDLETARFYALGMIEAMMQGREADAWHVAVKGENQEALAIVKPASGRAKYKSE